MILSKGTEIAGGRYVLVEHLGSGGMASVWLARDQTLERDVAIKVMSDLMAGDERWLERFHREARAAAGLQHRNVVQVFDYGDEDERPYLVMAYIPGGNLKDRLAGSDAVDARALARELLDALAHVHAAGILHRDVKPANILCDARGGSHLTDFGIARDADTSQLTQTGMVLGTERYLAPEVAAGEPASERSDLYSAGRVLDEAGGRDAGLGAVIDALIAEAPAERPPSAAAALTLVDEFTAPRGQDDTAATAVLPQPDMWRSLRATPWFAPLATLAAIAVLAALVITLATSGGGNDDGAPSVAPSDAPLSQQLDQLDRAIDSAP